MQILRKKRTKKNYQEILIEYLNSINNSNSKIDIVTKEMKTAFFSCMNDLVLSKNDELKYLILMIDEKYQKLEKENYFNIWKKFNINMKNIENKNNADEISNKKNIFKLEEEKSNDNIEEDSNLIIPDDDYIESLRQQNENNNNKEKQKYADNYTEKDKEYFTIEENNKTITINNNNANELSISNNIKNDKNVKKAQYKKKIINEQNLEKYKENLIIDFDDETNSIPAECKSDNSDEKNFAIIGDGKENYNTQLNLNKLDLKEKSINIKEEDYQSYNIISNKKSGKNDRIPDKEGGAQLVYNKVIITKNFNNKKEINKRNNKLDDINSYNNKSQNIINKNIIESNPNDIVGKGGRSFSEFEEENRLNYLLSSKNNINEKEAKNIITLKKAINDAIKKTNYNIQKINEHETEKINLNNEKNNDKMDKEIKENKDILKIEETNHITIIDNNCNINKIKSSINIPVNVENINLVEGIDNNSKVINQINNNLIIEKINIEPFFNEDNNLDKNKNNNINYLGKNNDISNQDKFSIIYNKEFTFSPELSHIKENVKNNIICLNTDKNKDSSKEVLEINTNLNDLNKNDNEIENKNNVSNNIININFRNNEKEIKERIINEEMIRNFLNNHKNERILQEYSNQDVELNFIKKNNKKVENDDYKNKYLGYTLEGTNRNKKSKNKTDPNCKYFAEKENTNGVEADMTKISKDKDKDNENNTFGLNKICNMLDDLFDVKYNKKNRNSNNTKKGNDEQIIEDYKNKKSGKILNKSKINDNSNNLDFSEFNTNELNINYINDESSKKGDKKNSEKSIFNNNADYDDIKYIYHNYNYNREGIINQKEAFNNRNNDKSNHKKNHSANKIKMSFPLSMMSFNQRVEHFNNKKDFNIEHIKKEINNIENEIYTFYPKTNKKNQKINYEYRQKSRPKISKNNQTNERKKSINYKRLNELYMDYKERNIRIKKLERENNIKDGISFNPQFFSNYKTNKRSKEKIQKIPFLNELENI